MPDLGKRLILSQLLTHHAPADSACSAWAEYLERRFFHIVKTIFNGTKISILHVVSKKMLKNTRFMNGKFLSDI